MRWGNRATISLHVPGVSRSWAQWRTKESEGLDCRFLGKSGQFNLSQIERFGLVPSINGTRAEGDVLHLVFQHPDHLHPAQLKSLLTTHLQGFRETFGKA